MMEWLQQITQFHIGCLILLLFAIFDKNTVRVQWDSLAKFIAFLCVIFVLRISAISFAGELPQLPPELMRPTWPFALVFWEDAFYVLPLLFMDKFKWLRKWYIWYPVAIALSINFGLGHAYQGLQGILITSIYPVLISYRYSKKVGMGTVMLAHILYDFSTFWMVKYAWMFI